jgi:hypothetical protein
MCNRHLIYLCILHFVNHYEVPHYMYLTVLMILQMLKGWDGGELYSCRLANKSCYCETHKWHIRQAHNFCYDVTDGAEVREWTLSVTCCFRCQSGSICYGNDSPNRRYRSRQNGGRGRIPNVSEEMDASENHEMLSPLERIGGTSVRSGSETEHCHLKMIPIL